MARRGHFWSSTGILVETKHGGSLAGGNNPKPPAATRTLLPLRYAHEVDTSCKASRIDFDCADLVLLTRPTSTCIMPGGESDEYAL